MLLWLRLEVPAPGLCRAERADAPPRIERERATPFAVVDEGAGERVVGVGAGAGDRDGGAVGGSVEERRPAAVPGSGFLVVVFIVVILWR